MGEPLRLAQFLRERCARNQYGLRYLNPEQTLLLIPWPVVPRPNEEPHPGFQMFHEWAEYSHRKRGNNEAAELNETATQQKHRFRNALARANGIKYRDDINMEGARVYELDCRRPHINSEVHSPYGTEVAADDYADNISDINFESSPAYNLSPQNPYLDYGVSSSQQLNVNGFDPGYQQLPFEPDPVPGGRLASSTDPNAMATCSRVSQEENDLAVLSNIIDGGSQVAPEMSPVVPEIRMSINEAPQEVPQQFVGSTFQDANNHPPQLQIQVRFRQEDASSYIVSNTHGCRIYFGKNIPDLSQLLNKEQLDNLMRRFRFNKDWYFGPDSFQQVQLPYPVKFMRSSMQRDKTEAILGNMDRGLLLFLEYNNAHQQMNVPDVFALRLCQTRIFPCGNGAGGGYSPECESLKRMEWTKVFDGKSFCEHLQAANGVDSYPSPSFSFSLGQKPPSELRAVILVSLTITVHSAQQLLQSRLDSQPSEVCISYVNSTDMEARRLANQLTETLILNDDTVNTDML